MSNALSCYFFGCIVKCYVIPLLEFKSTLLIFLFAPCSGKSTNFVHQHFYDANQSKQPKKSSSAAARRTATSTTYWGAITAYLQGCCCGGGDKNCCKSCSCSFSWCKCCRCCGWGTANNQDALQDSEGTNFDDANDLEAGLTERTPLIGSASKKSYTAVGNTTTTTSNSTTSATSAGNAAEDGLIRDRAASTDSQDQDQEQDQDDILDLEAGPQADQSTDNKEKESSKSDKKRKKKKPLSMYDNARLALGLVPSKIEHAQEVQLFTSDQQPAGKVRSLVLPFLRF